MARLRHHTFFSLAELNQCIKALLSELNEKPFKQLQGNRLEAFEMIDLSELSNGPRFLGNTYSVVQESGSITEDRRYKSHLSKNGQVR